MKEQTPEKEKNKFLSWILAHQNLSIVILFVVLGIAGLIFKAGNSIGIGNDGGSVDGINGSYNTSVNDSNYQHKKYFKLIDRATALYKTKDYKNAATTYSAAFRVEKGWSGLSGDHYYAACCWALSNYPDSAFRDLDAITQNGTYDNYDGIIKDKELNSLHNDTRWEKFKGGIEEYKSFIKQLGLDSIFTEDQKYRLMIDSVEKKYGFQSKEMTSLWTIIREKDSINLIKVTAILDKYGWLGVDKIGNSGNTTLFLVIQHSDQKTQEKYLPMMREAVKNGKAEASALALLEDRVALGKGKKQIYGSQIGVDNKTGKNFIEPIEDEPNVNKRRASVGLEPLEYYAKHFNINYELPEK